MFRTRRFTTALFLYKVTERRNSQQQKTVNKLWPIATPFPNFYIKILTKCSVTTFGNRAFRK